MAEEANSIAVSNLIIFTKVEIISDGFHFLALHVFLISHDSEGLCSVESEIEGVVWHSRLLMLEDDSIRQKL